MKATDPYQIILWKGYVTLERDKVLFLADHIVRQELGEQWTLEKHMKRKAEWLSFIDHNTNECRVA
jgi:hypothetical protein